MKPSKKLPHIPNTEKIEKVFDSGISVVGAIRPKLNDIVVINLLLESVD